MIFNELIEDYNKYLNKWNEIKTEQDRTWQLTQQFLALIKNI